MLTMDLIDTIVRTQAQSQTHYALQIWLNQRLNSDPLFRKKLQLAAIWQRAGRHSEASGGDAPNEYGRYCDDSAQYFATAAKKHLPEITDKELKLFCNVIQQFNFKEGTEPSNIMALLFSTHIMELNRMPRTVRTGQIEKDTGLKRKTIKGLMTKAKYYIARTGAKKMGSVFADCHQDMELLLDAVTRSKRRRLTNNRYNHYAYLFCQQ